MAVAVAEPTLTEAPAEAPEATAEPEAPPVPAPGIPTREPVEVHFRSPPKETGTVVGDTPLSAIERLAVAGDLSPQIRRRDRLLTAAWAVSFAALAALGVAGYTERDRLMQQWPASKRVYATLGLARTDGKAGDGNVADGKSAGVQAGAAAPAR